MVKEIDKLEFINIVKGSSFKDDFSFDALCEIYDHLNANPMHKFELINLVKFIEYKNLESLNNDLMTNYKSIEDLSFDKFIICADNKKIIIEI